MTKKTLILGTYVNAPYHPFQEVDVLLKELAEKQGLQAELTDDLNRVNALRKDGFSLLISYLDAFDTGLPEETAKEIESFVKEGGGLLCLHNGISLQTADRMFHLIGGRFLRHPPMTQLHFIPEKNGFLADCEAFALPEEPYQFEMSGDPAEPLLSYEYEGQRCPGGWLREEGKGKIVFLTPGHSIVTFRVEAYQRMIAKSIEWLA